MSDTGSTEPWRWLETTLQLQIESYGTDPTQLQGDALADFLTWNATALVAELGEFLNEVGWKNWAKPRGWVNREQAVGELVDMGHFLANLASALGVTDEEWEARYRAKQATNAKRQEDGYDGVSGKCRACKRDLYEAGVKEVVRDDGGVIQWCAGCGAQVVGG